jgi:hypothetical protein
MHMEGLQDSYHVQVPENISTIIHLQTKEWNVMNVNLDSVCKPKHGPCH